MKKLIGFAALLVLTAAFATDMEHKGKVIRTVQTVHSGLAEVTCNDIGGWKFEVSAAEDDGRDVVTVKITSATPAKAPQFGVFFRVRGDGVQNVWTSDCGCDGDAYHLWPKLWSHWKISKSQLAKETPIAVGFNSREIAPVALACSETFNFLEYGLYADDETCDIIGRCEFFKQPGPAITEYTAKVMLDRRGRTLPETVRTCTDWVMKANALKVAYTPEAAFDPLYSTWYAYLQDVHDKPLEEEARLAAELGMKTMILDDGWQKVDSATFYSAVGDWMPVPSRFPDFKAHVAAVHKAGLKYMLWLSVPHVGDESKAWKRFEKMMLKVDGGKSPGRTGIFDPRYPEVREYLISTYERAVRDWGFDGLKLDFIDSFSQPANDPAAARNYEGCDYRDVPSAVDRLMRDVIARLKKINPEVLIEFRQHYMGPAILQYGNMIRCADCPADPCANRRRICDLRLTSSTIAVHSDMLVWSKDETPEGAALPILNALYSTIQYSMILAKINPEHKAVIRHWLKFSQDHREALLKGAFTPHHAELGYNWIEGESASERVVTGYTADTSVRTGAADRKVFIVNATAADSMLVESAADGEARLFDVVGRPAGRVALVAGVQRVKLPVSGYMAITW